MAAAWPGGVNALMSQPPGAAIETRGLTKRYGGREVVRGISVSVQSGEVVGLLGSSGRSTGPHVHYEVLVNGEPTDPNKFLRAGKDVFKG